MKGRTLARIGMAVGVAVLSLSVAACSALAGRPAAAAAPTATRVAAAPTTSKAPATVPSPARSEPTKASAAAAPTAVSAAKAAAAPAPAPATTFLLQLDAPAEDAIVADPTLAVQGKTIPEAVVSVNGDLVKVGRDGSFATQLRLEEGANDLEVVASDPAGNEQYVIRSVIYEP